MLLRRLGALLGCAELGLEWMRANLLARKTHLQQQRIGKFGKVLAVLLEDSLQPSRL
jgi:hypothetical protein